MLPQDDIEARIGRATLPDDLPANHGEVPILCILVLRKTVVEIEAVGRWRATHHEQLERDCANELLAFNHLVEREGRDVIGQHVRVAWRPDSSTCDAGSGYPKSYLASTRYATGATSNDVRVRPIGVQSRAIGCARRAFVKVCIRTVEVVEPGHVVAAHIIRARQ
jgi:hypothetical protein